MICAYCGKEAKGTKEHIISSGILGLFPECFATTDGERNIVHMSDPMVKDVCADCNNNKISYIDSYAKEIIEKYFLQKYDRDTKLNFQYDFTLIQKMCLKFAFNDLRSRKKDYSFFDEEIINFLIDVKKTLPLRNVTIMAGLAVNTSPVPDFMFGNNKIRWGDSPVLLCNSIIMNINYETGELQIRDDNKEENFDKLALSYVFRFNSLQIIMLCWQEDISDELLRQHKVVLSCQYPYTILEQEGKSVLERCTSVTTYHFEKVIDVSWGQGIMDEVSYMRRTFSVESQQYFKKVEKQWEKEEQRLAEEHPRK